MKVRRLYLCKDLKHASAIIGAARRLDFSIAKEITDFAKFVCRLYRALVV
jgi:hypothetical protein